MALLHINTAHLIVNLLPQKQSGETQFVIIIYICTIKYIK